MANGDDVEKKGFWFSRGYGIWVTVILTLLLILLVGGLFWQNGSQNGSNESWLSQLAKVDFGRFLITASIVAVILIITVRLTSGLLNLKNDPAVSFEKRFSLGKELLTVFIGSLGTLMGFYFAENRVSPDGAQIIANIAQNPGTTSITATSQLETKAFDLLIKQDYDGAVKAFDVASKATPPSSNIANISTIKKYLADNSEKFSKSDDSGKKQAWRDLYCVVYNGGMAIGQSKEIIDKFASGCNPPPLANINAAVTTTPPAANTQTNQALTNARTGINSLRNANTSNR